MLDAPCSASTEVRVPRWVKRLGAAIGSGALGMTLAACYGAPCATEAGGFRCGDANDLITCEEAGMVTDPNGHCVESTDPNAVKSAATHAPGL